MTGSTFTRKRLALEITIGGGENGATVVDTIKLSGLRMTADIVNAGGETMGALQLRVYGLSMSDMKRLTSIGPRPNIYMIANKVKLFAGDDVSGLTLLYTGTITSAWADYNSAPDVAFNMIAQAGADVALKPVNPSSYKGAADVPTILQDIATRAGLAFKNNGVVGVLSNPYLSGTFWEQIRSVARAAEIGAVIENDTLIIYPREGATADVIPFISPETGLVGYPIFSSQGLVLRTIFNKDVSLPGKVRVRSSITPEGIFNVWNVVHSLSCELPGGPWFTEISCFPDVQ